MIDSLFQNWRTTSLGLTSIAGAVLNLYFAHKNQVDDQGTWMLCITQVLTGVGLIFSRDSKASAAAHEESKTQIQELQTKVNLVPDAIKSGDTSMIQRIPTTPATPPVVANDSKQP